MGAVMEVLLAGDTAGTLRGSEVIALLWSQSIMNPRQWSQHKAPAAASEEPQPGLDEGVAAMGTVVDPPSSTEKVVKQLVRCCKATTQDGAGHAQLTAAEIATAAWSLRRLGCTDRATLDAVVEAAEARIDDFNPDQEAMLLSAVSALLPPGMPAVAETGQ